MSVTRLAVVSDIHGNRPALEAVMAAIAREDVDATINLGDILSGPLWPKETAQRLRALNWPTIAGNHERQVLTQPRAAMGAADAFAADALDDADRAWLAALPPTRRLGDDVLCCHGTPGDDLQYLLETVTGDFGVHGSCGIRAAGAAEVAARLGEPAAALVLCGHSHVPRIVQVETKGGATLIVNPGSVGLQAYAAEQPHPHDVEIGSPLARWALVERRAGRWSAALHATPYDAEAAAVRAEANGRRDWADALRHGRVGRTHA